VSTAHAREWVEAVAVAAENPLPLKADAGSGTAEAGDDGGKNALDGRARARWGCVLRALAEERGRCFATWSGLKALVARAVAGPADLPLSLFDSVITEGEWFGDARKVEHPEWLYNPRIADLRESATRWIPIGPPDVQPALWFVFPLFPQDLREIFPELARFACSGADIGWRGKPPTHWSPAMCSAIVSYGAEAWVPPGPGGPTLPRGSVVQRIARHHGYGSVRRIPTGAGGISTRHQVLTVGTHLLFPHAHARRGANPTEVFEYEGATQTILLEDMLPPGGTFALSLAWCTPHPGEDEPIPIWDLAQPAVEP